jgi:hypothetical protein
LCEREQKQVDARLFGGPGRTSHIPKDHAGISIAWSYA